MTRITSLKNDKVKLAKGLQTRAYSRRKSRLIVLEGTRLVRDAIERGHEPKFILYEPDRADLDLITLLQNRETDLLPVTDEVLLHVSDTQQPQGVIGVFPLPTPPLPHDPSRILILDNLRDPGNMGTIFRTAAAAGIEVVLLSPGCVDPYNPKVLRGGMGAHFRVPVVEVDWKQIDTYCKSLKLYLAAAHADLTYDQADWSTGWGIIIGSEAHGAGTEAKRLATQRISIPMAAKTESLNAAIAAGILMFEAMRQHRLTSA